jgi:hypothetical protein
MKQKNPNFNIKYAVPETKYGTKRNESNAKTETKIAPTAE